MSYAHWRMHMAYAREAERDTIIHIPPTRTRWIAMEVVQMNMR